MSDIPEAIMKATAEVVKSIYFFHPPPVIARTIIARALMAADEAVLETIEHRPGDIAHPATAHMRHPYDRR